MSFINVFSQLKFITRNTLKLLLAQWKQKIKPLNDTRYFGQSPWKNPKGKPVERGNFILGFLRKNFGNYSKRK
jgi:hypothetical protein